MPGGDNPAGENNDPQLGALTGWDLPLRLS